MKFWIIIQGEKFSVSENMLIEREDDLFTKDKIQQKGKRRLLLAVWSIMKTVVHSV